MLSKDVDVVNGMVRIKTKDSELSDLREELSDAKRRLQDWKNEGRETGDVEYEIKQLEKEIQDLILKGQRDSKTKDGEREDLENKIKKLDDQLGKTAVGSQEEKNLMEQIRALKIEYLQKFKTFSDIRQSP
jgi:predicted  nucleic acid-binding Zn-ribbon protein